MWGEEVGSLTSRVANSVSNGFQFDSAKVLNLELVFAAPVYQGGLGEFLCQWHFGNPDGAAGTCWLRARRAAR